MKITRADKGMLAEWWFTVDRVLLASIFVLLAAGLVVSLAAGPAVAIKKEYSPFYFVERHFVFALIGAALVVGISFLTPATIRRLSLVLFAVSIALMVAILLVGHEVNGARRWLHLFGQSLQPSELAKPAFVILAAWAFTEHMRRPDMPGVLIGFLADTGAA